MSTLGFNHFNLRAPRALLDELKTFYIEVVGLIRRDRVRPWKTLGIGFMPGISAYFT